MRDEAAADRRLVSANHGLTLKGGPAAGPLACFSWALFEWARNPYPILIAIYVFTPYFSRSIVGDPVRGQALLGMAAAITGVVTAICAPILGAVADKQGRRKPWLMGLIILMVPAVSALWFARPGPLGLGVAATLALISLCSLCFEFSQVFHNAMLPAIAPAQRVGALSGGALALGNAAGVLLMLLVLTVFSGSGANPHLGLRIAAHENDRVVGPLVGLWLAVFALPLFLFTPDESTDKRSITTAVAEGLAELSGTIGRLREHADVARFLLARMVFNDGIIGILTFGGVYAAGTFGWNSSTMLVFGIITSFVAVLGGLLGGWIDDRLGSKRTLLLSLSITIGLLILQLSFRPDSILYFIPMQPGRTVWDGPAFRTLPELLYLLNNQFFGIFLTVTISSSRSMLARIAPPRMMTQFFGLYALSGSATGFMAPLLVGAATAATHSQRGGVASLLILLVAGGLLLLRVRGRHTKFS